MGAVVSWTRLLVKLVWMIVLMLLLVTFLSWILRPGVFAGTYKTNLENEPS
jgi:hypothetical protein